MKFKWDSYKNQKLRKTRGVDFEDVVEAIAAGKILDVLKHHNKEKYSGQYLIVVEINDYAYVVPCRIKDDTVFFITVYPSRKMTRKYLQE